MQHVLCIPLVALCMQSTAPPSPLMASSRVVGHPSMPLDELEEAPKGAGRSTEQGGNVGRVTGQGCNLRRGIGQA